MRTLTTESREPDIQLQQILATGVLMADSSLRVLGVISAMRAVKLLMSDKAYVLLPREGGQVLRSPSRVVDFPMAIALHRYVQDRRRVFDLDDVVSKRTILRRDNYTCAYCGKYGDTVDHIVPRAKGGLSTYGNMTAACHPCNSRKADKLPETVGLKRPRITPSPPVSRAEGLQASLYEQLELVT